jgi:hypothetical protein
MYHISSLIFSAEKIVEGLWDRRAVCLFIPLSTFEYLNQPL